MLKKRSLIIILSDFLVPNFETEIRQLSRRHETVLLHCYDDAERGVIPSAVYEVCDPETGGFFLLDAASKSTRKHLAKSHDLLQHQLEDTCRKTKSDYVCLSIEDDYLQRLVHFFRSRGPSRL